MLAACLRGWTSPVRPVLAASPADLLARGDTATLPVKALFASVVVNVALKVALMEDVACRSDWRSRTSIGAWIKPCCCCCGSRSAPDCLSFDQRLRDVDAASSPASLTLATALLVAQAGSLRTMLADVSHFHACAVAAQHRTHRLGGVVWV